MKPTRILLVLVRLAAVIVPFAVSSCYVTPPSVSFYPPPPPRPVGITDRSSPNFYVLHQHRLASPPRGFVGDPGSGGGSNGGNSNGGDQNGVSGGNSNGDPYGNGGGIPSGPPPVPPAAPSQATCAQGDVWREGGRRLPPTLSASRLMPARKPRTITAKPRRARGWRRLRR